MREKISYKLVVTFLIAIVVFSCLSMLIAEVKADTYNQIPLWINVMQGASITGDQIDEIEKEMDKIFSENGLNWRVTSVVLDDSSPDPDNTQDQPGDVREGPEEDGLYEKGKKKQKILADSRYSSSIEY